MTVSLGRKKTGPRKAAAATAVAVLSLGDTHVRALRAITRADELVVQRWAEVETAPNPADQARAVAEALVKAEIAERSVVVCLPARSVVIKRVLLPPATPEQLPQLVLFEAQRHLPLPLNQLATGFHALPHRPGVTGTEVLLAVAHREQLAQLEKTLAAHRITVEAYAVEALAVADAYLSVAEPHLNGEARLVLTPSGDGLHTQVLRDDRLLFTRFIPFSGDWSGDLRRSLTAYAMDEPEFPIGDAMLIGETESGRLTEGLGYPLRQAALHPAQGGEMRLQPEWGPLVGVARQWLRLGQYPLRIEPQGWTAPQGGTSRSRIALAAVGAAALAVCLVAAQLDAQQRQAEAHRRAERLTRQTDDLRKSLGRMNKERDQLREQWKTITGRELVRSGAGAESGETSPLELLQKVSGQAPSGIWLTQMSYERGKPLQFEGTSRDAAEVTRFLHTLSSLSAFKRVELGFLRSAAVDKTPVTHFRLDCYLTENAVEKGAAQP